MSRFDPNTYPDRFAFEAAARQIRSDELARLFNAAAAWIEGQQRQFARSVRGFVAATSAPSQQHPAR